MQNYLRIILFLNGFHSFTFKIKHSLENSIVDLIFGRVNVGGPNIVEEHVLFLEHNQRNNYCRRSKCHTFGITYLTYAYHPYWDIGHQQDSSNQAGPVPVSPLSSRYSPTSGHQPVGPVARYFLDAPVSYCLVGSSLVLPL